MMILLINGKKAKEGMILTDFRGDKAKLVSWREPHKISSSGFVYVRHLDKDGNETEMMGEYYAPVYNGKFVPEDEYSNVKE